MPLALHFLGGLKPERARLDQICSPRRSHRCILLSCSCSEGLHLLFKMRRIASGDTSKLSASVCVEFCAEF